MDMDVDNASNTTAFPNSVDDLVSEVTTGLNNIYEAYSPLREDLDLPATFHKAFQQSSIQTVYQVFEAVGNKIKEPNVTEGLSTATQLLKESSQKTEILGDILKKVASPSDVSAKDRYIDAVRQLGPGNTVEALMLRIMGNARGLAADNAIARELLHNLQEAIKELEAMEPSIPENETGNFFSHHGSGNQFNNTGLGKQFNNTGEGRQYQADVMNFKD
ncbi:SesA protein [Annulohypoxylon nitens]|nr:SesA protein [Annulohypoxylon nitens]